jgi:transposase
MFFESNFTINPQFVYENENVTRKYLKQFYSENSKSPEGIPQASSDLLKLATKILKAWIKEYGTETDFLQSEGEILSREDTEKV